MSALTSSIMAIIDSGASDHMWPYRDAFVEFTPLSGCYIAIANQSSLPVTGRGTVQLRLAGRTIRLVGVLCIPALMGPLFSIRRFRKIPGCGFFATNTQLCLAFPTFTVDIDDTNEVSLPYESAPSLTTFDFDEKSTVTRLPASSLGNAFGVTTQSGVHTQGPTIAPLIGATPLIATEDPSDDYPLPQKFKSPVPLIRPCDTPNSAAPQCVKLTTHQLHQYLGFRSLQDCSILHDSASPTVKVVNTGIPPLELGDVS